VAKRDKKIQELLSWLGILFALVGLVALVVYPLRLSWLALSAMFRSPALEWEKKRTLTWKAAEDALDATKGPVKTITVGR